MKRSQLDLIGERQKSLHNPRKTMFNGLLHRWAQGQSVVVEIDLPEYDYIRSEAFVDDVIELSDVRNVTVADIVSILYKDYVSAVRNGMPIKDITADIKQRIHYIKSDERSRALEQVTENHWTSKERTIHRRIRKVRLRFMLDRKHALRGEILLQDILRQDPEINLTIEGLMAILLIDFIREIQNGNQRTVVNGIIDALESRRY